MKTEQKLLEKIFESARTYARCYVFYTRETLSDEGRLYVAQLQIQTAFLFPLLTDGDRSILCRLYYLREWLDKAKDEKRFALSRQNLKQFRQKVRGKKSEWIQLKRRLVKSGLKHKLTEIQLQLLEDRYLSLPAPRR